MNEKDDKDIQKLLEAAGPRQNPPAAMRDRVHRNVLAAWEEMPAQSAAAPQGPAKRRLAVAAAAALTFVAGFFALEAMRGGSDPVPAATIERASGNYTADASKLLEDNSIVATADGRLVLRLRSGADVQMDRHTRVVVTDSSSIALVEGRIYVDGGVGNVAAISVATPHAVLTDIGTLFAVSVEGDAMTLTMREGEVRAVVADGSAFSATVEDGVGDAIEFLGREPVNHSQVTTLDASWDWVQDLRSPFEADRITTFEFLEWAARDSGRTLVMTEADAYNARQDVWSRVVPFDSDDESIEAALAVTAYRMIATGDHRLVVEVDD